MQICRYAIRINWLATVQLPQKNGHIAVSVIANVSPSDARYS